MTKQEFLAFSLPYGLKYKALNGIYGLFDTDWSTIVKYGANYPIILYPLSDLTKPIEHKGEKFVPIEKLSTLFVDFEYYFSESQQKDFILFSTITKGYNLMSSFNAAIKLISWHFDIAGLIEKGEAIDVNTLETNPYK